MGAMTARTSWRIRVVGSVLAVVVAVGFAATAFALGLVVGAVARFSNPHETAVVWALFVLGPGLPVGVVWGWVLAPSARSGALTRSGLANQAMLASLAGVFLVYVELTAWSSLHRPRGRRSMP